MYDLLCSFLRLGRLGATFCLGSGRPQELVVYASRPGLRVWLADKNGVVQQTLIYKVYYCCFREPYTVDLNKRDWLGNISLDGVIFRAIQIAES
jgi:hypothetical protein